ncbi:MAG: peptidase M14, partial [Melioribacteraceae bacterium]
MQKGHISQLFYDYYENYKELLINCRRFTHKDLLSLIKKIKTNPKFEIASVGKSLENRDIFLIKIGTGETKVLSWSQMHGDESTATMALFDLFNFFSADDKFNNFRNELLEKTTLYFIPMLNPDGAEKFERTNALNIDLNRDALRLQFPESQTLKLMRDEIKPEFGFNLHDQNTRYSAGNSFKTATISMLAPPFN